MIKKILEQKKILLISILILTACSVIGPDCTDSITTSNQVVNNPPDTNRCLWTESYNAGASWSVPDTFGREFKMLYSGALNGQTLTYVIGGKDSSNVFRIWRMESGGTTFQIANTPNNMNIVHEIQNNEMSGTFIARTSSNLFRSSDDGVTWTSVLMTNNSFYGTSYFYTGEWFAVDRSSSGNIFYSSNDGVSWTSVMGSVSYPSDVCCIPGRYGEVVVACGSGILRSTNMGVTWTYAFVQTMTNPIISIASDGFGLCYNFNSGYEGIYYTNNFGQTWGYVGLINTPLPRDLYVYSSSRAITTNDYGISISLDPLSNMWISVGPQKPMYEINVNSGSDYMFVLGGK